MTKDIQYEMYEFGYIRDSFNEPTIQEKSVMNNITSSFRNEKDSFKNSLKTQEDNIKSVVHISKNIYLKD